MDIDLDQLAAQTAEQWVASPMLDNEDDLRDAIRALLATAAARWRAQLERDAVSICRLCKDAKKPATETPYGWKHDGWDRATPAQCVAPAPGPAPRRAGAGTVSEELYASLRKWMGDVLWNVVGYRFVEALQETHTAGIAAERQRVRALIEAEIQRRDSDDPDVLSALAGILEQVSA